MKVKANGKTFTFPDGTSQDDIGTAIDEYFGAQPQQEQEILDRDVDGMAQVPMREEQMEQQLNAELPSQQSTSTIDTSYKPITLGERVSSWWNDEELRDPGVNPYEGMTAAQIAEQEGVRPTRSTPLQQITDEFAISDDRKIGADSAIQSRANELLSRNPDMSEDEAFAKSDLEYRQERARVAATAGSMFIPGSTAMKLLSGGFVGGAGGEVAAQGIEALEEGSLDRSFGDRALDVAYSGGRDALFNLAGGKAGEWVAKGVGSGVRAVKGMAPRGMEDLAAAGSETAEKVGKYRGEYGKLKGGEAETLSKQETFLAQQVKKFEEDVASFPARSAAYTEEVSRLEGLVPLGVLTREQAEAAIARVPVPKAPVPPNVDEYVRGADEVYEGVHKGLEDKYLDDVLESLPGVTARDVFDAQTRAGTLAGDFKVGTGSLAEQIDNFKLSQEVRGQALGRELDDAKALGFIPLSKKMQETVGLRDPDLYRIREKEVKNALGNVMDELEVLKSAPTSSKSMKDIINDLEAATAKSFQGKSGEASKLLKSAKVKTDTKLPLEENSAAHSLRRQIESLNKIKTKSGESSSSSADSLLGSMGKFALGGAVTSGIYDYSSEGKVDPSSIALGALLGITARKTMGKLSQSGINRRLNQVSDALGGRYKVDEAARQMIESGEDVGKVITYIVMRHHLKEADKE